MLFIYDKVDKANEEQVNSFYLSRVYSQFFFCVHIGCSIQSQAIDARSLIPLIERPFS